MPQIQIHVVQHKKTGLLAAVSDDLEGFIVHAHDEDELFAKLPEAFEDFMEASGKPVSNVQVEQNTPAGFWPPSYTAKGTTDKIAA
jgi:hypothetical protein